jgi:hypothetical protein
MSLAVSRVLLNPPPHSAGQHHLLQAGPWWSKDQEVLFVLVIGEAATDEQEMAPIVFPAVQDGNNCPVKESGSLGSFAHAEPVPVVRLMLERFNLADLDSLAPIRSLKSDRLMTSNRQHVGISLILEPGAQVQVASVHSIGYHP